MESMYPWINRIEAYDGKILKTYKDIVIPSNPGGNPNEIGCTFSHIKAIITAYKNGDDGVIIMEDDIYDTYRSKWVKSIDEIIRHAPNDADCVVLHCSNGEEVRSMSNMEYDYSKWNPSRSSTGAYYINKNGMRKIYDVYFKDGKIKLDSRRELQYAEPAIYTWLNTYNYTKPLFIHQFTESTLHPSHIAYHKRAYDAIINYFSSIKDTKHS
jgi:GR25 family glycosyltransferase involved in LPS biosynthesis